MPGGGGCGVTGAEAADSAELPIEFDDATLKVYEVPFVSPVLTKDLVGGVPVTVPGLPCWTPATYV